MNILFVCSGNIFRSMGAEYCLKDYVEKKKIKNVRVSSAGITANPQKVADEVKETLLSFGIDVSKHKQRKLTKEIIGENDLIVAMGENHKKFIKKNFGVDAVLFIEICYHLKVGLIDTNEAIKNYLENEDLVKQYDIQIIKFIHNSIPKFVENMVHFLD